MSDTRLYLISVNQSRRGDMEWSSDDYDVRDGAPDAR
jgi:hypothetical protein